MAKCAFHVRGRRANQWNTTTRYSLARGDAAAAALSRGPSSIGQQRQVARKVGGGVGVIGTVDVDSTVEQATLRIILRVRSHRHGRHQS
jgi:hypothetical protein